MEGVRFVQQIVHRDLMIDDDSLLFSFTFFINFKLSNLVYIKKLSVNRNSFFLIAFVKMTTKYEVYLRKAHHIFAIKQFYYGCSPCDQYCNSAHLRISTRGIKCINKVANL